jgi:putative cardiolipin synthase
MKSVSVLFVLVALTSCASLKNNPDREESHILPKTTGDDLLNSSLKAVTKGYKKDESAFMLLVENDEALRWRLALIDNAKSSIDLQVFIWQDDEAGRLIALHMGDAARRGVRVRLLIDDLIPGWTDEDTAITSQIDNNFSIRKFNPGHYRKGFLAPIFEWGLSFQTLNRRMHNKQMLIDGNWAVVGGRNIGNEYFGLEKKYNFRDMGLLVAGPIVKELGKDFDAYWNSDAAYPGKAMYKNVSPDRVKKLRKEFAAVLAEDFTLLSETSIPAGVTDWSSDFKRLPKLMVPGVAVSLLDPPTVKGEQQARGTRLEEQIRNEKGRKVTELTIMSPYLIPPEEFFAGIKKIVGNGGKVNILTASMAANNHTSASSHYKKYRKDLIRSGASLYEFRANPGAEIRTITDTDPIKAKFLSLHIKAFVENGSRVSMGSLNMDPRSLDINTENLLVIDSSQLAKKLMAEFNRMIQPENAWKVHLNDKGRLRWTSDTETRKHQPARSFGQRISDFFFRLLPIESQL